MKKKHTQIAFIFKNGRKSRMNSQVKFPSEFFYGFIELKNQNPNFHFVEDSDLGINSKIPSIVSLLNKLSYFVPNFPLGTFLYLFNKNLTNVINSFEIVIPTTNTFGLLTSLGKKLNIIKAKIVFLSMGVLNNVKKEWHLKLIKYLFSEIKIVCLSKAERKYLEKKLNLKVEYIPFGVDIKFWRPKKVKNKPFVMAIGNDLNRDWDTLINSWSKDLPNLKIFTNLPVKSNLSNIEIISSSWNENLLSDANIKELYCSALFIIIPLKNTFQPSGQSSCLQAMACKKTVILTKTKGLWDKKNMKHNQNVIFVPPSDTKAINSTVKSLLKDKRILNKIGKNARKSIENHFNTKIMAKSILSIINEQKKILKV